MSKQKKIMLLGGIHYLLPVIKAAHEQGYYVITADYLPDNVAHKFSDEYVNVSIVDKEAVLKVAQEKQIDGIISFGVDPGVVAAAYVQEKMGLPSMGPYESVEILQNKDKFRKFLQDHGFNCPKSKGYSTIEDALNDTEWLTWPMIVKPTDSAGSKGVTRVDRIEDYKAAVEEAFAKSIKGNIIVEQYLEKVRCSSDTDSFLQDGKWRFVSFNAQRFDADAANPYAPSAYTWPSTFPEHEVYLTSELQRLMDLLHMNTSVFNIETRIATDGKPYIMEATPRGGGNRLCEMLRYATGVDMITAQVRAAVGEPVEPIEQKPYNGHWAEVILHAPKAGTFAGIKIADTLPAEVIERDLWVKEGDGVEAFHGANDAIGTLVLRFEDKYAMEYAITHQSEWLKIQINNIKDMKTAKCIANKAIRPAGGGIRRIIIRKLEEKDALTSYKWRNDKEVFKFTGNTYNNYISYEIELEWIKQVIKKSNEYRCAIEVDGKYVGNIYLTDIDSESAEYHIFIGEKEYWGKGVAEEASKQILKYGFEERKLKYVYLHVREDNVRAVRLYNKLNFIPIHNNDGWILMKIDNENERNR